MMTLDHSFVIEEHIDYHLMLGIDKIYIYAFLGRLCALFVVVVVVVVDNRPDTHTHTHTLQTIP